MKIARESWVIAALGIADLVTTIIFIEHHGAEEANPLFRYLWDLGLFAFVMAKLILLACPLFILEWARKRNPRFTIRALRGAIAGYLLLYGIGFARLNGPAAQAGEIYSQDQMTAAQFTSPDPASIALWAAQHAPIDYKEHVRQGYIYRTKSRNRSGRQRGSTYQDTGKLAGLRVPHILPYEWRLGHRYR